MPRLTSMQKRLIRDWGKRLAGSGRVTLELGDRVYIGEDPKWKGWRSWNLHPSCSPPDPDTDLYDNLPWSVVAILDMPPEAVLDFYVYSLGHDGELKDNLIVHVEGGKIVELRRTCDTPKDTIWRGEA
jgi:hypothetical protein